jgi:hypothetical protein
MCRALFEIGQGNQPYTRPHRLDDVSAIVADVNEADVRELMTVKTLRNSLYGIAERAAVEILKDKVAGLELYTFKGLCHDPACQ